MASILLLGAGFSANWGAPVASGMFNLLLANQEIQGNAALRTLLWANQQNFENALGVLQHDFRQNADTGREPLLLMQRALGQIFGRMSELLRRQEFELRSPDGRVYREATVVEFLARFDAIFTLNQDLLIETHYLDHDAYSLTSSRRWNGAPMPGMTAVGRADFGGAKVSGRIWNPTDDFAVPNNAQPIYKLHGSINWKGTGPDTDMVIMGGGKPEAIQAIPVLRHYHEIFGQEVRRGGTRVTIIGYGFGDKHINDILEDGVRNHGTRMFVIDPRGSRLAYEMRPYQPGQIGEPAVSPFEEWFHIGLHSASSRPFRQLLWNDSLEGEELVRFIGGN